MVCTCYLLSNHQLLKKRYDDVMHDINMLILIYTVYMYIYIYIKLLIFCLYLYTYTQGENKQEINFLKSIYYISQILIP